MTIPKRRDVAVSVRRGDIATSRDRALVLGVYEDRARPTSELAALDRKLGGSIRRLRERKAFRGRAEEQALLVPAAAATPERIVLVGLGPRREVDLERLRRAAARGVRAARSAGADAVAVDLFEAPRIGAGERARAITEGIVLGAYSYDAYRSSGSSREELRRATLLVSKKDSSVQAAVREGRIVAEAANFTRDLSNTPPCDLTPAALASEARRLARSRSLRCKVLTKTQIEKAGMLALYAVGQGSANEPRFIHLDHDPGKPDAGSVALVGKGITFDTGGISLKPSNKMWDMKFDKCGATAVLGAVRAAADLDLPIRVHAIVPAAENMPSRDAYRPSDIVRTYAGKTIEVQNTDAEGRLILADALHYATRLEPDVIVDLATLTGACVVALGHHAAGLFASDDSLAKSLERAGKESGERVWRMPMFAEYRKQLESRVADMRNVGGRPGGAVTAAWFLREFAGDVRWAHLDIAGVADTDKKSGYHQPGSTGFGVRLLTRFLEDRAAG